MMKSVRLRPPLRSDAQFLSELFADESVNHNLVGGAQRGKLLIEAICEHATPSKQDKVYWIAECEEGNAPVGYASALHFSKSRVEICFAVAAPFRGQSYGLKLLAILIQTLKGYRHIETLVAIVKCANTASKQLIAKFGFQSTGFLTVYELNISRAP